MALFDRKNKTQEKSIPNALLSAEEVTQERILSTYITGYYNALVDQEGDIVVEVQDTRVSVKLLPSQQAITLFAFWELNPRVNRVDFLELAGKMNDKIPLIRVSVGTEEYDLENPPRLWIDYTLFYGDGITTHELIAATERFVTNAEYGLREFGTTGHFVRLSED